jgi:hypothetical protein
VKRPLQYGADPDALGCHPATSPRM